MSFIDRGIWDSLAELAPPGEAGTFLTELVGMLERLGPEQIAAMRKAADGGDTKALTGHAHKLKGCCGNLGALALAAACEAIETGGRAGKLPPAGALDELARIYDRTAAELHGLCNAAA